MKTKIKNELKFKLSSKPYLSDDVQDFYDQLDDENRQCFDTYVYLDEEDFKNRHEDGVNGWLIDYMFKYVIKTKCKNDPNKFKDILEKQYLNKLINCEDCFSCFNCKNCNNCDYCSNCTNCDECSLCDGCRNLFSCFDWDNVKWSKEDKKDKQESLKNKTNESRKIRKYQRLNESITRRSRDRRLYHL